MYALAPGLPTRGPPDIFTYFASTHELLCLHGLNTRQAFYCAVSYYKIVVRPTHKRICHVAQHSKTGTLLFDYIHVCCKTMSQHALRKWQGTTACRVKDNKFAKGTDIRYWAWQFSVIPTASEDTSRPRATLVTTSFYWLLEMHTEEQIENLCGKLKLYLSRFQQ